MDGNGRWALKKKKKRNFGHKKGVEIIPSLIKHCQKIKVKYLTLFVFSYNNWKRPVKEINYIFDLFVNYLNKYEKFLKKNDIKLNFLGEKDKLNQNIRANIKLIEKKTSKNKSIVVNLAFNYSSRKEILNSINKLLKNKKIKHINKEIFEKQLHTSNIPDPDILIRTGGYSRVSDFLLWQISYTELYFLKKLWPDFNVGDLKKVIKNYCLVKRNYGSI